MDIAAAPITACKASAQITVNDVGCDAVVTSLLDREAEMLTFAVSYDAGYRSLLQFTGIFGRFLDTLSSTVLSPLRQTAQISGALSDLPCFLSQCDE